MAGTSRQGGFTKKLILSMLLVGLLPLLIGLSLAFYFGMREIREVNGANFQALAVETARRLDLVVVDEQTRNQQIAKLPVIIQELENLRDQIQQLSPEQVQARLSKEDAAWKSQDSTFQATIIEHPLTQTLIRSVLGTNTGFSSTSSMVARSATRVLYVTDILGRVVATTNANVSYLHQQSDWWKGAFHTGVGKPYISNLEFDDLLRTYTFSIAVPVMDSIRYRAVGVLHRVYDAKEFFAPSIDVIHFGKTGHVMLMDSDGRVISCPILNTGEKIADSQLIPLVTPLIPGWTLGTTDGHGGQDQSIIGFSALPTMSRVMMDSTGKPWHLFVWQSSEELFAPVYNLRIWIVSFGLISSVLLLILGVLVSRQVVRPLRDLQSAAQRIANREMTDPITIKTGDEIEDLAEEINHMNMQLQAAFSGLLSEVETKTQEVKYLRESTTQILEGIPDPVIMVDEHLDVKYMNQAFMHAAGLTNGWGDNQNLLQLISPSSQEQQQLRQEVHNLLDLSPTDTSANGDGETRMAKQINDPLLQHNTDSPSAHEHLLTIENRIFRYDWFPVGLRPGENPKYGILLRDTTDEKRLQDQLINSEKSTSLGVLCSGIGHELNNPLVGVIGLAEAIQDEEDVQKAKSHAKAIVQQGQRMAKVIRDLVGQIRNQEAAIPTALDLNVHLDLIVQYMNVKGDYPEVTIRKEYHDLPPFYGQTDEIRLLFFHVIKNAIQAMEGKGLLTLRTHTSDSGNIEIRIEDTGIGISPNLLAKVFDPFFTTKFQGEGSGLGLTIVQRIVQKYGGRVGLESVEGQGTQCSIILPGENQAHNKEEEEKGNLA
ncbi:ATP-binding protein [Candidatus Nitronereus thalassa]|uniref:histidine kinase n=1 Tax=Candidatus Nitronereus thalassa TaxID=3020898 RepID=A0ABU3K762_9BACT|nr:ATP-binding protein [Candidatus Nitronereus thalassa]MDT7042216.1 ATP-binding protein [Candidatus Nitronereus thalassa]